MAEDRAVEPVLDRCSDLVSSYLPLARARAVRYAGHGESLDDLLQVGALGLVAAARRFDPGRGVPFAAYALPTIDGELRRHLRDRAATVRLPRRAQQQSAAVRQAAGLAAQRLGREPSLSDTAAAAGVSLDEARAALRGRPTTVPLSELDGRASGDAEDELAACVDRALVDDLVARLPARERSVLRLRFGGDLPQAEIARRLGISQSQASRLLASALEKLRHSLAALEDEAA
jgi:RNA polymerase sigma-B factor